MHTGDKFQGVQCKCMACAEARRKRVEHEAMLTRRSEMRAIEDRIFDADELIKRGEDLRAEANIERSVLLDEVREQLVSTA